MEYKIALLLKEHYYSRINDEFKERFKDVSLDFYAYQTLYELNETFLKIKDQYDGFLVSGIFPLQSLRVSGAADEDTLIEPCPVDVENIFQILLRQMIVHRDLKLSRVGIDFVQDDHTLAELIQKEQFAANVHSREARWKTFSTMEQLIEEEDSVTRMYEKLYKENKIDMIVTYFYSAAEHMSGYGLDCFYAYPSDNMLVQLIEKMKAQISIKALRDTLFTVIRIDMEEIHKLGAGSYERYKAELDRIVMEYNKQYYNRMVLKNTYSDLELYTDCAVLRKLTSDFRECRLWKRLNRELGFNSYIGYGVGKSLYQARVNAIDACHYGRNGGAASGGSFLIDEHDNLTVLDIGGNRAVFQVNRDYVNAIANKVKLSAETIVRLMGIMDSLNTDELSSQELMTHLNVSLRSANKFLSSMERNGYACVVRQKRNGNKGRPINIYRLELRRNADLRAERNV